MTLSPGSRLGPYEVLGPLGAGGMGEVYKARDTRLDRTVAIKVLPAHLSSSPDLRARFEREAHAASALNHPHICTLHDIGQHDGVDFLVLEHLEGETLADRLTKGPLPVDQVLRYGIEIAEALAAAHKAGIVHRDLKPGNVMLTKAGTKLLDFGLAKLRAGAESAEALSALPTGTAAKPLTSAGTVMGTFRYMSPEQVEGKEADARADLWALGTLLYEMATGKPAFSGKSQASLIAAILKEDPRPMRELQPLAPPALDRLVRACLAKDPDERMQNAGDVARELGWMRESSSEAQAGAAVTAGSASRRRRLPWLIALVVVMAIGYVAGARFGLGRASPLVSYQRLTFRRGHFTNARFAPDGQTVLYGAVWEGQPLEIFQARPGGGELPLGLRGADLLSVSRSGEMAILLVRRREENLYFKVGTLARVPLSGGTPRELAEDVRGADWAPDGESLAVVKELSGKRVLEFPLGRALYETFHLFLWPRVSPEGNRVAFVEQEADSSWSVVVVDRSGVRRVLSSGWSDWWNLTWSPDGKEVWFGGAKVGEASAVYAVDLRGRQRVLLEGPGTLEIHDVSRDGRALVARVGVRTLAWGLAPGETRERDLSWLESSPAADLSADGRMLLLEVGSESLRRASAFLRRTDGSPAVRLGDAGPQQLSPDGKWALAVQNGSPPRLLALPTGAGEARTVKGDFEWISGARWAPDGRRILALARERGRAARLYLLDVEGGQPQPVSKEVAPASTLNVLSPVSPDGRLVAVVVADGRVLLYPLDGGEPRPALGLAPNELPIQWSLDGRQLYAFGRGGLPTPVFSVDVASGHREPLRELMPRDPVGVTDLLTVRMTPDGKSYVYSYSQLLSDLYLVDGLK